MKRILSLLLAAVMLSAMLPVGVAVDALPEDEPTAQTGTPVTEAASATGGENDGQTPDIPAHTDGDAPNTDEGDAGDTLPNADESDAGDISLNTADPDAGEPNETVPDADNPDADDPDAGEDTDEPAALPEGAIPIDETHFSDGNFRAWLTENCGPATADDGTAYFTAEQANSMTWIECESAGFTSVQGIEYFPNLSVLSLYGNALTSIDVSHNTNLTELRLPCNNLTSIDVSALTSLSELHLDGNSIGSIDLSHNTNLTVLNLHGNRVQTLDLSQNADLTWLRVSDTGITALDLSHNPHITSLETSRLNTLTLASGRDTLLSGNITLAAQEPTVTDGAVYYDLTWLLSDTQIQSGEENDGFDDDVRLNKAAGRIEFADESTASGREMQLIVRHQEENGDVSELWINVKMAGEPQGGEPDNPDNPDEPYLISSWGVAGGICGTDWNCDFPMTETYEGSGVWVSATLELWAWEEFKVRADSDWVLSYGPLPETGRDNCWVEEDGVYIVVLDLNTDTPVPTAEKQDDGVEAEYPHDYQYIVSGLPEGALAIDGSHFANEEFRNWMLNNLAHGETDNGLAYFSAEQLAAVTEIRCENADIYSLDGIGYFPNLTTLYCANNHLSDPALENYPNITAGSASPQHLTIGFDRGECGENGELPPVPLDWLISPDRRDRMSITDANCAEINNETNELLITSWPFDYTYDTRNDTIGIITVTVEVTLYDEAPVEEPVEGPDIPITAENFPDTAFRTWILENLTHETPADGDPYFTAQQAADVYEM